MGSEKVGSGIISICSQLTKCDSKLYVVISLTPNPENPFIVADSFSICGLERVSYSVFLHDAAKRTFLALMSGDSQ